MPEIKNTFTSGKMNKDLDERLVPKGEYRDAMNIQISTSEGSDIGAIENVLGNLLLNDTFLIPEESVCVGAIADEKNNTFYWFTTHATKDAILKYDRKTGSVSPVLIDTNKNVLNFSRLFLITGINIIDGLLLWTDNRTEPKKINIKLCEQGTNSTGAHHTRLVVPARKITYPKASDITEENITVIKKSPKQKLSLQEVYQEYNPASSLAAFTDSNGEPLPLEYENVINFTNFTLNQKYNAGDIITLALSSDNASLPLESQIRIELLEDVSGQDSFIPNNPYVANTFKFKVTAIATSVPTGLKNWNCLKLIDEDILFERKFPRFSYRYKYQDGEYSTFAPFTDVVFKAQKFNYNAFKAYNTGMENRLQSLKLRNFITPETPQDVIQIDILYKESNSPLVYIVDKIKYNDFKDITIGITTADNQLVNSWQGNQYEIKSDIIYAVLPNNQLLRQYDNVPRLALAQEITGSRVVYGNYLQNYDILDSDDNILVPAIKSSYTSRYPGNIQYEQNYTGNITGAPFLLEQPVLPLFGHKSLKSMRSYQLGFTYLDTYGRETPVFSSNNSVFNVPKKHGGFKTKIIGEVLTNAPSWADSFKVYVKETSTEYYNMAMSRVYRAEDGNIWLAFPSTERNKIDEDTFLILKKGFDSNELVKEKAKYKVLAIENEAPDYIKTETSVLGEVVVSSNNTDYLHEANTPTVDSRNVSFNKQIWTDTNAAALTDISDSMRVEWQSNDGFFTSQYEISTVTGVDGDDYNVTLTETFKDSDSWIYPGYPTTVDFDNIKSGLTVRVLRDVIVNRPEFDGVFFVKINSDAISEEYVFGVDGVQNYEVQNKLYTHYFSDTLALQEQGFTNPGTTQVSNTASGPSSNVVSNSKEEWARLLKFGSALNPKGGTTDGDGVGGFFIDQLFYRGVHYDTPDEEFGKATIGPTGWNDPAAFLTTSFSRHNYSYQNRNGFGRGVFEENGKYYIELSYSKMGNSNGPNSSKGSGSFALEDDSVQFNYSGWPDGLGMKSDKLWKPNWDVAMAEYQTTYGGRENELAEIVDKIRAGQKFKIQGDEDDNVFKILNVDKIKRYNHTNFRRVWEAYIKHIYNTTFTDTYSLNSGLNYNSEFQNNISESDANQVWKEFQNPHNRRITYRIEVDKDISDVTIGGIPLLDRNTTTGVGVNAGAASNFPIQFITPRYSVAKKQIISDNPAIWETEPKESAELDIYYEASDCIPLVLNDKNFKRFIPIGSIVTCPSKPGVMNPTITTTVTSYYNNYVYLSTEIDTSEYQGAQSSNYSKPPYLVFSRPDGSYTTLKINAAAWNNSDGARYEIIKEVHNNPFAISWFNCYSFVNGVESNRVRDTFNSITLDKGAKASSTLDETYESERRTSGLIYSGIYNSISGVNNLNQFIQAEAITKDLNPSHGSIQKLYQRDTDLITFCEDKVLRINANKDTLFNADGNSQVIASNKVLGNAIPYVGDFGISKNPESFASESYRLYFTDKQRGAVLRLSRDGLTPISTYGMQDYFKDNLKNNNRLIGSYDDKKNNYNLTLVNNLTTISFDEKVNGWSSFKSFVPEIGISMANDYYTFKKGLAWIHHSEHNNAERNTFYKRYGGTFYPFKPSSVSFLLNDSPSLIKSYKTLGYEGSQSNVNQETTTLETGYYNLSNKDGWRLDSIITDKQEGYINEFIEKEGKWFNYIKANDVSQTLNVKTDEFSFQGIGRAVSIAFDPSLYVYVAPTTVFGCMNISAGNYNPNATIDDGSCVYGPGVNGCTDPNALNYDPLATFDDGSCVLNIPGCTNPQASNYNPQATVDDNSCILSPSGPIYGCTDSSALNYDPNATIDDSSCILGILGCIDPLADNYDPSATQDDGSCTYSTSGGPNLGGGGGNPSAQGCTDPLALNYDPAAASDDGSCVYPTLTIQDTNDDD